jgi:nitrous oxide reductase accessory protein NosL
MRIPVATPGCLLSFAAAAWLTACAPAPQSGPAEIKWDRDVCAHCGMAISDRHFAAAVRGGPRNEAFKFDDIGCALQWLAKQPWGREGQVKIWVARHRDGEWLDARAARYLGGKTSPMGFNYAAVDATEGGVDFEELKRLVLAAGHRH